MESISCAAKRKKRKTRKCLDEIRKRAQGNFSENAAPGMSIINNNKTGNISEMKPNVYITSKRLTLEMFPKVIRSETVTRPILSEINKDYNVDLDRFSTKRLTKPTSGELFTIPESNSDSDCVDNFEDNDTIHSAQEKCSGASQISIQKESDSGNLSTLGDNNNSPGSYLLFSPVHQTDDTDLFEVSSKETMSSPSAPTSHNFEGLGNFEALYEEFINEMPMHLKQNAPDLLKDDVMKETREMINKMHLESLNSVPDTEDYYFQSMRKEIMALKGSASETWEPIPRKYMRPGRRIGGSSRGASTSASSATSTTPDPALVPTTLLDTPEYTYYPHKLNQ